MNFLTVFYSRTGNTKKIAIEISNLLNSDLEEIIDFKKRKGLFGFLISGFEATTEKIIKIKPIEKTPEYYDLVVICSPIWVSNICSPVRAYLKSYGSNIKNIAFVSTCIDNEGKSFIKMENLVKKPKALLVVKDKEIKNGTYIEKIYDFIGEIKQI